MANHDVKLCLQTGLSVKKGDVLFEVKRNGRKYGTLKVSQGSVVWRQKSSTYGKKLKWDELQDLFDEYGKSERK